MKRALTVLAVLAAACSSTTSTTEPDSGPAAPPPDLDHPAVGAFEEWRAAIVRRDFDGFFAMLSSNMKAYSLWDGYGAELARGVIPRVGELTTGEIDGVRAWWQANYRMPRPSVLPEAIEDSPWLRAVLRDRFAQAADDLANHVEGATVVGVVPASEGLADLRVRLRNGTEVIYEFAEAGDRWLYDYSLEPPVQRTP